jgi:hypothetical protein
MKTFFAITLARLAASLELADNYLAQVEQTTVNGVTHPADSPLDLTHSSKTTGKVSYQIFFDKEVTASRLAASDADLSCGENFDADIHMCCFKFNVYQPFVSSTTTTRYAMTVQQNCPPFVNSEYNIDFEGFSFIVDGKGSSHDHTYSLAHEDNAGTYSVEAGTNKVSFELNNVGSTLGGFKHFSYFWAAHTWDNSTWDYSYDLLSEAAASTAAAS